MGPGTPRRLFRRVGHNEGSGGLLPQKFEDVPQPQRVAGGIHFGKQRVQISPALEREPVPISDGGMLRKA